ncbi:hypothetical protein HG530_002880 [Fusarium avenaceum]|nr:hypothetical protein HG530_002880 [Fusarium avenaceum]
MGTLRQYCIIPLDLLPDGHAAHDSHQRPHIAQLASCAASSELELSNTGHGLPAAGVAPYTHDLLAIAGVTLTTVATSAAALGEILFTRGVVLLLGVGGVGTAEAHELVTTPAGLANASDLCATRASPFEALNSLLGTIAN